MKGLRAKEIRGNEPEELNRTLRKLQEDLFKHHLKKNTNQLENTMVIRNTRREIARVNTVLGERLRQQSSSQQVSPQASQQESPQKKKAGNP
jgi:large subunit ribosomal protein L29